MIQTILLFTLRPDVTDEQIEALRAGVHTAWLPRSCCKSCMNAASTSYDPPPGSRKVLLMLLM